MKILVLAMAVCSLMLVDSVCNGMKVATVSTTANKSTDTKLPPVVIEVELDKNGNIVNLLSCRPAERGDLFLIGQPAAKAPEVKTFSLGNGVYLFGWGVVNTVTGVVVVVGVVVQCLSSVVGSTAKALVSKLWSAGSAVEAKQPAAAA